MPRHVIEAVNKRHPDPRIPTTVLSAAPTGPGMSHIGHIDFVKFPQTSEPSDTIGGDTHAGRVPTWDAFLRPVAIICFLLLVWAVAVVAKDERGGYHATQQNS